MHTRKVLSSTLVFQAYLGVENLSGAPQHLSYQQIVDLHSRSCSDKLFTRLTGVSIVQWQELSFSLLFAIRCVSECRTFQIIPLLARLKRLAWGKHTSLLVRRVGDEKLKVL